MFHHISIPSGVAGKHVRASTERIAHAGTAGGVVSGSGVATPVDAARRRRHLFATSFARIGGAATVVLTLSTVGSLPG